MWGGADDSERQVLLGHQGLDDSLLRRFRLGDGGLHAFGHLGCDAFGHGAEDSFLVGKIGIGGRLGDGGLCRNRLHGGSAKPGKAEDALGGVENARTPYLAPRGCS